MTIDGIYRYVLDLYRKDGKGNTLQPSAFTNWLQFVVLTLYEGVISQAEQLAAQGNVSVGDVLFKMAVMRNFIKTDYVTPVVTGGKPEGYAALPTDCKYPISAVADGVLCDIKSPVLRDRYTSSVLNGDVGNNPAVFALGTTVEFLPNDISTLSLTYLRTPAMPYYDWCIDTNDTMWFMPVGSSIALDDSNVATLYDSAGGQIATSIVTTRTLPYTSVTVEVDWDETQHGKIGDMVAEKLGINLRIAAK